MFTYEVNLLCDGTAPGAKESPECDGFCCEGVFPTTREARRETLRAARHRGWVVDKKGTLCAACAQMKKGRAA